MLHRHLKRWQADQEILKSTAFEHRSRQIPSAKESVKLQFFPAHVRRAQAALAQPRPVLGSGTGGKHQRQTGVSAVCGCVLKLQRGMTFQGSFVAELVWEAKKTDHSHSLYGNGSRTNMTSNNSSVLTTGVLQSRFLENFEAARVIAFKPKPSWLEGASRSLLALDKL